MKAAERFGGLAVALLTVGCAAGAGGTVEEAPRPGRTGEAGRAAAPIVVGVILPRSGSEYLERYGERVLEGVELAVRADEEANGPRVRLEVIDDGGDAERAVAALQSLERRGAVAVIGPLLPAAVEAAIRVRSDDRLALINPLGSEAVEAPNAYALNAPDALGAEALARFAARAGLRRVGLLYPRTVEHRRQAIAFSAALQAEGGQVVAEVPYDSGTTTFATQLKTIAEAEPQALFVPAPERDVHQIAPQITYYGLAGAGVRVLGGDGWTAESVRYQVAARYLDGVVATTPLLHTSAEVGWNDFVARYEQAHRRSLDGPLPALGFDAMRLVLEALGGGRASADEVARRLREVRGLRAATGVLMVEGGRVVRRPFLVRIEQRALVPVTWPEDASPPASDAGWRHR